MQQKKMLVKCPRCGEEWSPNPDIWRNINSVLSMGKKRLHCPNCNKPLTLSKETTKILLTMKTKKGR